MSAIRHQINIGVGPRAVWRAITTADGLMSWWADEARVDSRAGGRVVVTTEGEDGEPVEEAGVVLDFTPTRRFEINWDRVGKGPNRGSRLTFQLARTGTETRVSLVQSGGDVLKDEELRSQMSADWKSALRALRSHLEK
jgi:uncharacterized protein YndB with AHSA1/START domain